MVILALKKKNVLATITCMKALWKDRILLIFRVEVNTVREMMYV